MRSSDVLDRLLIAGLAFAAGTGFGLLVAPMSGARARRHLAASARETSETARTHAAQAAAPLADAARTRARHLADRHVPLAGDLELIDARDILDDLDAGRD